MRKRFKKQSGSRYILAATASNGVAKYDKVHYKSVGERIREICVELFGLQPRDAEGNRKHA